MATTIQVNTNSRFRREVAEAIVKQACPGYHGMGYYYANIKNGKVYYAESLRAWNPWSDSEMIVAVDALVSQNGNDFSSEVDWRVADFPSYRSMVAAYLKSENKEFESNGDIPEWVLCSEVIDFAREYSDEWAAEIEEIEAQSAELAIDFALSEILDEVTIEE